MFVKFARALLSHIFFAANCSGNLRLDRKNKLPGTSLSPVNRKIKSSRKKIVYSIFFFEKKKFWKFPEKKKSFMKFCFFNRCSSSCARSLIRWPSYTCITTVLWYIIGGSGSNTLQGVNVSVVHNINIINCQYKA